MHAIALGKFWLEIRCINVSRPFLYEYTWPDGVELLLNHQKVGQFKALTKISSLNKRRDQAFITKDISRSTRKNSLMSGQNLEFSLKLSNL